MHQASDAPLAPWTTMRVGGPAARLVTAESQDEIIDAVRAADAATEPLLVMAGGSNLVIADEGFAGTVVRIASRGIDVTPEGADAVTIRVAAGEGWDGVVARAVSEGWAGIEALSGIPGTAGATPVQNVGAYGQEVAQTLTAVRAWDRTDGCIRTFTREECRFAYRHSRFKATSRYVVLDVTFRLRRSPLSEPIAYADLARALGVGLDARAPLAAARQAVLDQRRRRGMVLDPADHDTWSCGSFFTNPVMTVEAFAALQARLRARLGDVADAVPQFAAPAGYVKTSAAWLIEHAGFGKGHGLPGPAALSTRHTLAITNRGAATAGDILALARAVRDGVEAAFGVRLVNEPVLVGRTL